VFLGRDYGHQANYSDEVAANIDAEVRKLIDDAHDEAKAILEVHRDVLDRLADELIEKETLDTPELAEIMGHLAPWAGNAAVAAGAATSNRKASRARTRPKIEVAAAEEAPDVKPARRPRKAAEPRRKPAFGT